MMRSRDRVFGKVFITVSRFALLGLLLSLSITASLQGQLDWRPIPDIRERERHAMAYDLARQRVVLFGGAILQGRFTEALGDTWEWDGRRWHVRKPVHAPAARSGHAMAYDPVSKRVLLHGGLGQNKKLLSDTWAWDGQDWTQLSTVNMTPRWLHAMATDWKRSRIVLFGGGIGIGFGAGSGALDDTWEWDGKNWRQQQPAVKPPRRLSHGMAFCPASGRVTLYGGSNGFALIAIPRDTWDWDGRSWIQHATSKKTGTPLWTVDALVTDAAHGTVVLDGKLRDRHGTAKDEHWSWNGKSWTQLWPAARPPRTTGKVPLVSDLNRRKIVWFGGRSATTSRPIRDTWIWDGKNWTLRRRGLDLPVGYALSVVHDAKHDSILALTAVTQTKMRFWDWDDGRWIEKQRVKLPPARGGQGMVYLSHLGKVLLFGGTLQKRRNDTWLWDGQHWVEHVSRTPPPATMPGRFESGLVYDSQRRKAVLVVSTKSAAKTVETWEWDTGGWQRRSTKSAPPNVAGFGLAYDPVRGRTVLFGAQSYPYSNDTWEWDGKTWRLMPATARAPRSWKPKLAYVRPAGGVVAIDGDEWGPPYRPSPDTWVWNGKTWRRLPVRALPSLSAMFRYATVYDSSRERLLLFDDVHSSYATTTWELSARTLRASKPYPLPGQRLSLDASIPSQAGRPFITALALDNRPGIALRSVPGGVLRLPLAPDALFLLSFGQFVTTLDAAGKASLPLVIPNDKRLTWLPLHAAGFTLQPGPQPIGWVTNAVELEIVR